jgi:hypothetical protein
MPKKKCPACGSMNTVPIMYGLPAFDAMEAVERGELVLGGCFVTEYQPQRHCMDCKKDFEYKNFISTLPIEFLQFNVGGFFGKSNFVYFDSTHKNKIVRFATIPGGMFIDLKHPRSKINECLNDLIKEKVIPDLDWMNFMDEIEGLEINCWQKEYVDLGVCDGTQWNLNLKITGIRKISIYGSNEYPPHWKKLLRIINKYVGEKII